MLFFLFYCLLYNRGNRSLSRIGYYSIYLILQFIQYHEIYNDVIDVYVNGKNKDILEESIIIDCDSITGIRVNYDREPLGCLCAIKQLSKNVCIRAIENNHVKCLEYLCTHGYDIVDIYVSVAIRVGSLECLKFLCSNGGRVNWGSTMLAAHYGQLSCLMYLHDIGCCWDEYTCIAAIENDNLDCLRYVIDNNCRLSDKVFQCCSGLNNSCTMYLHNIRGKL